MLAKRQSRDKKRGSAARGGPSAQGQGGAAYSPRKKKLPEVFCSRSSWLLSLLMRGRKLVGSRRNVMSRDLKKRFMPGSSGCGL